MAMSFDKTNSFNQTLSNLDSLQKSQSDFTVTSEMEERTLKILQNANNPD